jgi:8-oxo-dGTP pyrophosphatase MutT (NUDIX family)
MRTSVAALALITRSRSEQTEWLAQWNERWGCYSFVGGHKRDHESFRECVVREIAEELHLEHGIDFGVSPEATFHFEYEAYSRGFGQQTQYTVELFSVELKNAAAHGKVDADPHNRWLSPANIRDEAAEDERPVSPTMGQLLRMAKMIGDDECGDGRGP